DIGERRRAEQELADAKRLAEAASEAKSSFLATMSHEIRTPLNGVLGMVELMLAGELSPRQAQYARTAQRSGESLLMVINDILDFSKMEAGFLTLNAASFSLSDLAEGLGCMFAESARRKDLELIIDLDPTLPDVVRGDSARLRQVLTNLLGNAIKFTDAGEVVLQVSLLGRETRSARLRFAVTDTGVGIPGEAQTRIFDAFAQADDSTTRRHGGTGLGLAISAALIDLMGGSLSVDSEPGEGACFEFTLNLPVERSMAGAEPFTAAALASAHVLVIDDNTTNRTVLSHQIRAWGARCEVAGGGVSGLQKLRSASSAGDPMDLVVLDMHMPGMDGFEVARSIRADTEMSGVRLVVLSSIADQLDGERCAALDIACHLTKPVQGRELARALDAALRNESGHTESVVRSEPLALRGRVLVAEDHPVNQDNAREMLVLLGLEVEVVDDGVKAVQAATHGGFDLVLMDWQMPHMDGLEATREIRRFEAEQGQGAHLPVIAITANALQGDAEACKDAGMDDYLSKPFRFEALREILARYLDEIGVQSVAAQAPPVFGETLPPVAGSGPVASLADFDAEVLDPEMVTQILSMDQRSGGRFFKRLYSSFSGNASMDLDAVRTALAIADHETARARAHALKGASANVGASTLSALCLRIEQAARQDDTQTASQALVEAEQLLSRVLDALASLRQEAA
ncbi:MAG: response regulator, partial [Gammaproteobacteria bacterium]|nr:response regulator [Gammaproteobacteria bacterium]